MIRINLLAGAEKRGARGTRRGGAAPTGGAKGSAGGGALIGLLLVAMIGLNAFFGYQTYMGVAEKQAIYRKKVEERDKIKKQVAEQGEEASNIRRLQDLYVTQWEILQSLDSGILWSEKINMLSKLIPASVFLTEVNLTEDFKEVETQASIEARKKWETSGKKTEKPEIVRKPVVSYTLRLVGLATGEDSVQQLDNVWKFHEALVTYATDDGRGGQRRFMDNFNTAIDFEYVEATLYEKQYPVQRFAFKLTTIPVGGEKDTPEGEASSKAAGKPARATKSPPAKRAK